MNLQVYRHHTRLITDAMLVRAIEIAVEDNVSGINELYHYSDTKEFVQGFLNWDDENLIRAILDSPSSASKELMDRLRARRLLKEVYSKKVTDFEDALVIDKISRLSKPDYKPKLKEAEKHIAELLTRQTGMQKVEPKFVIVDILNIGHPTFRPPGVEIKIDDIIVVQENKNRKKASDYEGSIIGSAREEKDIFVKVYATMDDIGRDDRERMHRDMEGGITEIFVKI
jgi:HD superfamily phosphohydrolase